MPKIKPSFIKTMIEKYNDTKEHAEEVADRFIQIFMDAANYGFSVNHSLPYSYVGYIATWLRYYYSLEFATSAFEIWKDDQNKINKVSSYAQEHGITLKKAIFGKSKGLYFMDKDNNSIYEGTASIKGNNSQVGDLLYDIAKIKKYENFCDLLLKIHDDSFIADKEGNITAIEDVYKKDEIELQKIDKELKSGDIELHQNKYDINKTKMVGLIRLGYFDKFGSIKKLQTIYDFFKKEYKPNNKTLSGKAKKYQLCVETEKNTPEDEYSFIQLLEFELYYTGKCSKHDDRMPSKYGFIVDVNKGRTRTRATVYSIKYGKNMPMLVGNRVYNNVPFKTGDLISIEQIEEKPKSVFMDGQWTKHPTDVDIWVKQAKFIRKGEISK